MKCRIYPGAGPAVSAGPHPIESIFVEFGVVNLQIAQLRPPSVIGMVPEPLLPAVVQGVGSQDSEADAAAFGRQSVSLRIIVRRGRFLFGDDLASEENPFRIFVYGISSPISCGRVLPFSVVYAYWLPGVRVSRDERVRNLTRNELILASPRSMSMLWP